MDQMDQKEFEKRKAAQIRALNAMEEKPALKVIDLIEMLLGFSPSLPVVIQVGTRRLPITCVLADDENNIQIRGVKMDSFERSQLQLRMKHIQKTLDRLLAARGGISSHVRDDDNRKMFQRFDVCCIELLGYFNQELCKVSNALVTKRKGKRKLIVTRLSDIGPSELRS